MPACLSRSLGLPTPPDSSLKMQDAHLPGYSQGIISILPSSSSTANISALRRTLSADMSSKRWIAQSGIRKIPSVGHLNEVLNDNVDYCGSGYGSGSGAFEEIWNSIQREQRNKEVLERPKQTDIWSSILTQKANEEGKETLPPPYIHPLVKRSASSLSEKSLKICTESLGSETGSDGFSSSPASELCDSEQEEKVVEEDQNQLETEIGRVEEVRVSGAARYAVEKAAPRALPPPLLSLGHRGDGSNLHMQSHRQNGRLVLEAVSVASHNCFQAKRQGGRLLLTFSDDHPGDEDMDENSEEEEDDDEGEDQESDCEEEEEEDDVGTITMDNASYAHKFLSLTRSNTPPWPQRLNKVVSAPEDGDGELAAAGEFLNPYVCSWRSNAAATMAVVGASKLVEVGHHLKGRSVVVVAEGQRTAQVEYLVPFLRGCNQQQPRRSLLLWEPQCITT